VTFGPPPSSLDDALRENAALRAELAAAEAERALLREEIGVPHALVAELQEALRKNSSNSSRPPSTDAKKRARDGAKKPSGKKRGAQPDHPKHERALLPPGAVVRVVSLVPAACGGCGGLLVGGDPNPRRRQVFELPPNPPARHRIPDSS
jgi:transposase